MDHDGKHDDHWSWLDGKSWTPDTAGFSRTAFRSTFPYKTNPLKWFVFVVYNMELKISDTNVTTNYPKSMLLMVYNMVLMLEPMFFRLKHGIDDPPRISMLQLSLSKNA